MKKIFWLSTGITSLILGLIGVLLPLLPTTPFLLLAAVAFAQSSPQLHQWLVNHPRWGVIIKNWHDGGRIDKRSKIIAITLMVVMPFLSYLLKAPLWAIAIQIIILLAVASFIITRPS